MPGFKTTRWTEAKQLVAVVVGWSCLHILHQCFAKLSHPVALKFNLCASQVLVSMILFVRLD